MIEENVVEQKPGYNPNTQHRLNKHRPDYLSVRQKKQPDKRIMFMITALLILLSLIGSAIYMTVARPEQTLPVISELFPSGQSSLTPAQQFQASYQHIVHTAPALNDPLTTPDLNDWDTNTGCSFTQGTYQIDIAHTGYVLSCFARHTHFSNFAYQAEATLIQGDAAGIAFRGSFQNAQSYLFLIRHDRSYSIYYNSGLAHQKTKSLAKGESNLIHNNPGQKNVLAVIARQHTLNFYINATYLTGVTDTSLTAGQIGLIAGDEQNATKVRFSQIEVWPIT